MLRDAGYGLRRIASIFGEQRRPIRFLVSRLLMLTSLSRLLSIRRQGYSLHFFPTALSAAMWTDEEFRWEEEEFLRRCLKPGDIVIDAGANIGSITLAMASAVGRGGTVLAIEPHPRLFNYLRANIERNGATQVKAIHCALGAKAGSALLSDRRSDDQNAVLTDGEGIVVPLLPLDDIAPEGPIALLKVDVEGYEYFVFAGAPETLQRVEIVYFEYVPALTKNFATDSRPPWQPVIEAGFRLFERTGNRLYPARLPPQGETMLIGLKDAAAFARRTGLEVEEC